MKIGLVFHEIVITRQGPCLVDFVKVRLILYESGHLSFSLR